MQSTYLKKLAINVMIGSLVGAAAVAVMAILIGEFSDVIGKALFTLLIVTLHALVCLSFLDNRTKSTTHDLSIFTNTIFALIVFSFFTAVFGIWGLLSGDIVGKLYLTYFIAAFAALHGEMLHKTTGLTKTIDNIVYSNYVLMGLVIVLLLPLVWLASDTEFADFYYRLLAASAIVDATLTILAVILHKLHLQKHPQLKSELFTQVVYTTDANGNQIPQTQTVQAPKRGVHPLLVVLGIFILLQFTVPMIFFIGGMFAFR